MVGYNSITRGTTRLSKDYREGGGGGRRDEEIRPSELVLAMERYIREHRLVRTRDLSKAFGFRGSNRMEAAMSTLTYLAPIWQEGGWIGILEK